MMKTPTRHQFSFRLWFFLNRLAVCLHHLLYGNDSLSRRAFVFFHINICPWNFSYGFDIATSSTNHSTYSWCRHRYFLGPVNSGLHLTLVLFKSSNGKLLRNKSLCRGQLQSRSERCCMKTNLKAFVISVEPDQPVYMCSLVWIYASCIPTKETFMKLVIKL